MTTSINQELTFTLTISNTTSSTFWRDDNAFDDIPPEYPYKIMPFSDTVVTLKSAIPSHLNQSIQYHNKKALFATQIVYTNYSQSVKIASQLSYYHLSNITPLPPIARLEWQEEATSIGDRPVQTAASLTQKNNNSPYSYSMIAHIIES
jgi:hypothetical protein